MAIASEAGELLSELRWVASDQADSFVLDSKNRDRIEHEVGDVGIAILLFCQRAGIDLLSAIEKKIELNEINYPVALSKGRSERPRQNYDSTELTSSIPWIVVAVRPLPQWRLNVEFADGTTGRFDYSELIHAENAGVFAALRDMSVFNQVFIEDGAVTWPGKIDVAPDAMYDRLRANPQEPMVRG